MDAPAAGAKGTRTRRRKKADEEIQRPTAATAATADANTATAAAVPAGEDEASMPKPSLSQRMVRSLKQSLGGSEKAQEEGDEVEQLNGGREPLLAQADETELAGEAELAGGGGARKVLDSIVQQPGGAALLVTALALALLLLGAGAGHVHSQRQLADLRRQLGVRVAALAAADRQAQRQLAELSVSQSQLREQAEAAGAALDALQRARARWEGAAADASAAAAQLAELRTAVERLRTGGAAAAPAAGPAATAPAPGQLATAERAARKVAAAEAAAAIERFAADRTGLPDYALAAAGGRVVGHSPALPPCLASQLAAGRVGGRLAPLLSARGDKAHPQASAFLLAPLTTPGACLPLAMDSPWAGHVDLQLAAALRPSALTYEHIPRSIAYDPSTAPRNMTLHGYFGPPPPAAEAAAAAARPGPVRPGAAAAGAVQGIGGQGGVVLGSFVYDVAGPAVQTFPLAGGGSSGGNGGSGGGGSHAGAADGQSHTPVVDHVRLVIESNHGNTEYTCIYRIRVHGTTIDASGSGAAMAASGSDY